MQTKKKESKHHRMKSLTSFVLSIIPIPQPTLRGIPRIFHRPHARMNGPILKSDEKSPKAQQDRSSAHVLLRSMTTLSSYHSALSLPSEENNQVATWGKNNDNDNVNAIPQHTANNGDFLAIVLPKEWQDFNLNKKDEANRIDPSIFDGILSDSLISTSCNVEDSSIASQFDTIVDTKKYKDPNNLIVSLDLDMNVLQEEIQLHMNRKATEEASRTFSRLELSAANRILSALNPRKAGVGKAGRKQKRVIANRDCPRSKIVVANDERGENFGQPTTASSVNIEQWTIRELCEILARDQNCQKNFTESNVLSLVIPMDETNFQGESVLLLQSELQNVSVDLAITTNPPSILSVETFEAFGSKLFTGVPVVIQTTLIHASRAQVSWFVDQELALYDSHCFVPKKEHVGKMLSVVITPLRDGYHGKSFKEAYRFDHVIEDIPYMPIVSPLRDDFTSEGNLIDEKHDLVRVMTYNILADMYVSREVDDETFMFPHVKYEHIRKTRRMPMIVAEILAYKADIICLQEVDGAIYDAYFDPVMKAMGYDGFYSNKASCQREGCALFWSKETFEKDEAFSISLRDLFDLDNTEQSPDSHATRDTIGHTSKPNFRRWDSMKGIKNLLKSHPELRRVTMEKIGQILQVVKLKVKATGDCHPKKIVVGNTHLFYHPMADHIRAMQTYVVCKKIDEVRRCEADAPPYPLILCGDLNSDPLSGASQLLFTRSVEPDHHDCWKHLNEYQWDMGNNEYMLEHQYIGNSAGSTDFRYEEEEFKNAVEDITTPLPPAPTLILPEAFPRLVSGCEEMPEFTNYAVDFVDTLDYVLASQVSDHELYGFVPVRSARMPTSEEIKQFIAMPNEFMPSDHVSVVADFQYQSRLKVNE
jgi:mRNA deadenylase, exonuclease subunit and related nucleases